MTAPAGADGRGPAPAGGRGPAPAGGRGPDELDSGDLPGHGPTQVVGREPARLDSLDPDRAEPRGRDRTGGVSGEDDGILDDLRRQAGQLIADVSGPLRRIRVRRGDAVVEIEWHGDRASDGGQPGDVPVPAARAAGAKPVRGGAPDAAPVDAATEPLAAHGPYPVVSPMVGTFYRAPEPGAAPFVTVGDLVEPNRVIGIVEAMKLMNEITAGRAGRVVDVLVQDGQPVEFGQVLIALAPL